MSRKTAMIKKLQIYLFFPKKMLLRIAFVKCKSKKLVRFIATTFLFMIHLLQLFVYDSFPGQVPRLPDLEASGSSRFRSSR